RDRNVPSTSVNFPKPQPPKLPALALSYAVGGLLTRLGLPIERAANVIRHHGQQAEGPVDGRAAAHAPICSSLLPAASDSRRRCPGLRRSRGRAASTLPPESCLNSVSASKNHCMASMDVQRVPPHWSVGRMIPRLPLVDHRNSVDTLVFLPRRRAGTR